MNKIQRVIRILLLFALVVAAGAAAGYVSNDEAQVSPVAFAAYTTFPAIEDLSRSSDLVVRGEVVGDGEPFIDRGLAPGATARPNEDPGVAMRSYQVRVKNGGKGSTFIRVVALDPEVFGTASGGAVLNDGEDLFLFLEESKGAAASGAFSVTGGRQGLYRQARAGIWERDSDPHLVEHGHEEHEEDEEERPFFDDDVVAERALERAIKLPDLIDGLSDKR